MRNISAGAVSFFKVKKARYAGVCSDFVLPVEARSHPLSGRIRCRPSTGCRIEKESWREAIRKSERAG